MVIVVSALFFKKDFIIFLIFILRSLFIQIVLSAQDISNLNMRTENGRKVSKTNLIYNPLTNSVTYKSYVDAIAPNEIYYWELPLRYCGDKVCCVCLSSVEDSVNGIGTIKDLGIITKFCFTEFKRINLYSP